MPVSPSIETRKFFQMNSLECSLSSIFMMKYSGYGKFILWVLWYQWLLQHYITFCSVFDYFQPTKWSFKSHTVLKNSDQAPR